MDTSKKKNDLIYRYLAQQKELFGNELWRGTCMGRREPACEEDRGTSGRTPAPDKDSAVEEKSWQVIEDLGEFRSAIKDCQACSLGATRTNFVFGVGDPHADLLFIGEAPGHNEDLQGEPFVGRAGQLLDRILQSIDLDRSRVYIANILKCRPPNNRDPQPGEIATCEPYLLHQIRLIDPVLIVALGRVAGQTLLRTTEPLGSLRGTVHDYHGRELMVTYHPAALLRNNNLKRPTWEDMKEIRKRYLAKTAT